MNNKFYTEEERNIEQVFYNPDEPVNVIVNVECKNTWPTENFEKIDELDLLVLDDLVKTYQVPGVLEGIASVLAKGLLEVQEHGKTQLTDEFLKYATQVFYIVFGASVAIQQLHDNLNGTLNENVELDVLDTRTGGF